MLLVTKCKTYQLFSGYMRHLHCFTKKRNPYYFCEYTVKCWPILTIFGSTAAEKICNKNMHVYPPHLFTVLIPYLYYLVEIMIHLPVFTWCFPVFKKRHSFYFCDYSSQMLTNFYNIYNITLVQLRKFATKWHIHFLWYTVCIRILQNREIRFFVCFQCNKSITMQQ